MDRRQVAQILQEVAAMLELAGENPFKVRAYENAAQSIANFPSDLSEALATGRLREVPGIGDALFGNVLEIVSSGRLPLHEELSARFPPGLRDCLRLPGLGAKKVKLLHEQLGIDSLEALERACLEGTLASVKGFGPKSAQKIVAAIAALRMSSGYHRSARAGARASDLVSAVRGTGLAIRAEVAGSLRRQRELVRDIDLVASAADTEALRKAILSLPGVTRIDSPEGGPPMPTWEGIGLDLFLVHDEEFAAALLHATGSQEHVQELQSRAALAGLALDRLGLFRAESRERIAGTGEEEIYSALGLAWVPPELREATGEIDAAARGELPRLVEASDLRGLIHVHTTDSDGREPIETMVDAARQAGYEYVAITDHSKSAAYAGGLTEERVLAQRAHVRSLRERYPGFRIFHGTEADILADGSIDFGDPFLEGFDLVVASVHSRFGLSRDEQTRRLIRAVRNPLVSILGHPSGRLLLSREPLSADWESVLAAAADAGCAIEINCNPRRLDLDWRLCRAASEAGIPLAIDPDAHSVAELSQIPYGIAMARKGWVTAESVLNAKDAGQLADWLARRRGKPLDFN